MNRDRTTDRVGRGGGKPLPGGGRLAYTVTRDAWYWQAMSDSHSPDIVIEAQVCDGDDATAWEFIIASEVLDGENALKINVFDEAFDAFVEIPDFFAALATEKPQTLEEVVALLDRVGAEDITEREAPRRARNARRK